MYIQYRSDAGYNKRAFAFVCDRVHILVRTRLRATAFASLCADGRVRKYSNAGRWRATAFASLCAGELASVPGLPVRISIKRMRKHSKLARGRPGMIHHVRVGQ